MPCTVDTSYEDGLERRRMRAALCAILTCMEKHGDAAYLTNFLKDVDWNEAGITREWLVGWWAEHRRADEARRERERAEADRVATAKAAVAKLTAEERRALGL